MSLAVLLIDLQRDFITPDGAYGRGGVTSTAISSLPRRLRPLLDSARAAHVPVIASHFTLAPIVGRDPIIAPDLRRLRPFLGPGDFCPGRPGHGLIDEVGIADVSIEKVAYSAFYQSRLEWVLRGLDVNRVLVAGIVTNGGVASTVRDAHVRGFGPVLVTDGCAAFDDRVHEATVRSLASIVPMTTIPEACKELSQTPGPVHDCSCENAGVSSSQRPVA
jgi:ureidoacrylate peracid hydrolase